MRLIQSTLGCVKRRMAKPTCDSPPPAEAAAIAYEIRDYSIRNYKAFDLAVDRDALWSSDEEEEAVAARQKKQLKPRHQALIGAWDRFLGFWNGHVWCDAPPALGPHHCLTPQCRQGRSREACERRAAQTTADLAWRCQPCVPTKGKWTKLGPVLDWHLLAQGLMGVLQKCCQIAFGRLSVKLPQPESEGQGHDQAYLVDVDWHAVQGQRCAKLLVGLADPKMFVDILCLALVLEPLRWLTRWFLRRSSVQRRLRRQQQSKPGPICDLLWYPASPATRVLQYLSCLLDGSAPRLRLLWGRRHNSWEEWCEAEPDALATFRRAVCVASGWVFIRFQQSYLSYPWLLANVVDTRRPMAERRAVAQEFLDAPEESLDL